MTTTIPEPTPRTRPSSSVATGEHQRSIESLGRNVLAPHLGESQVVVEAHNGDGLSGERHSSSGIHAPFALPELDAQSSCDTPTRDGVNGSDGQSANEVQPPIAVAADTFLALAAATLDDIEKLRIATANRIDAMAREGITGPESDRLQLLLDGIKALEHQATLDLQRALRKHPLGPWVKRTIGVGEKQGARLIAAIGDPAWNSAEDRPRRGPAELWAYCGFRPDQKRRKGVQSNWNADAKMRAYLIAESCLKHKATSPYGPVYDAARASWADRDVADGHKHNHALRCVAKKVLRDLFLEARKVAA